MRATLSFPKVVKTSAALVAAGIGLSLHPLSAQAVTIGPAFTLTGDPGTTITYTPTPSTQYTEASLSLSYTQTSPDGFDAGVLVTGAPGFLLFGFADLTSAAMVFGGGFYSQNLFGDGEIEIGDASYDTIALGYMGDGVIYAAPGSSTAVVQLDVDQFGGALPGPPTGYLVLKGTTTSPISLATVNPICIPGPPSACIEPYFNTFTLDWTATYQKTPYMPTSTKSAIPESSTWAMMLLGFAGLGFMGWRASRRSVSFAR
jgi:hypothetical protein